MGFIRRTTGRSGSELPIAVKCGARSKFVHTIHHFGTGNEWSYAILELYAHRLNTRITPDVGLDGEDAAFWRIAIQITLGLIDIHRSGVLHLALQVTRTLAAWCESGARCVV